MCQPMLESEGWKMGAFSRLSRFVEELPGELYERWMLEEEPAESVGGGEDSGGAPRLADADEPRWMDGPPDSARVSEPADPDEPDGLRYEYDGEG